MASALKFLFKLLVRSVESIGIVIGDITDFWHLIRHVAVPVFLFRMGLLGFSVNLRKMIIYVRLILNTPNIPFEDIQVYHFFLLLLFYQALASMTQLSILIAVIKGNRLYFLPYLLLKGVSNLTEYLNILSRNGFPLRSIPLEVSFYCISMFLEWLFVYLSFKQMA